MATSMAAIPPQEIETRIEIDILTHINVSDSFIMSSSITATEAMVYKACVQVWNMGRRKNMFQKRIDTFCANIAARAKVSEGSVGVIIERIQNKYKLIRDYKAHNGYGRGISFEVVPYYEFSDDMKNIEDSEETGKPFGKVAKKPVRKSKPKEEKEDKEDKKEYHTNDTTIISEIESESELEKAKKAIMQQFGGTDSGGVGEELPIFYENEVNSFAKDLLEGFKEVVKQAREIMSHSEVLKGVTLYPDKTEANGVYFECRDSVAAKSCAKIVQKIITQHEARLSGIENSAQRQAEMLKIMQSKMELWLSVIKDKAISANMNKQKNQFVKQLSKFNPNAMAQWEDVWKMFNPPFYKSSPK